MNLLLVNTFQAMIVRAGNLMAQGLLTGLNRVQNRNPRVSDYVNTSRWIREMGDSDSPWDEYGERTLWIPLGPWTKECTFEGFRP